MPIAAVPKVCSSPVEQGLPLRFIRTVRDSVERPLNEVRLPANKVKGLGRPFVGFLDAPRCGNRFGVGWRILSSPSGLDLAIEFSGTGQEVSLVGIPYWFGRCVVTGTLGNQRVQGVAHVYIRAFPSGTSAQRR